MLRFLREVDLSSKVARTGKQDFRRQGQARRAASQYLTNKFLPYNELRPGEDEPCSRLGAREEQNRGPCLPSFRTSLDNVDLPTYCDYPTKGDTQSLRFF